MKKILLFILLLSCIHVSFSQGWEKRYRVGYSGFETVAKTNDGYMACGYNDYGKISLFKTNFNGDSIFRKTFNFDFQYSGMISTLDNGFVLPTTRYLNGQYRAVLMKTNQNGDTLWTRSVNSSIPNAASSANSVVQDKDGNLYFIGYINGDSLFLTKYSKDGSKYWQKNMKVENIALTSGHENIKVLPDGNLLLSCGTYYQEHSITFIKLNAEGNKLWEKNYSFGPIYYDRFTSVTTLDGGFAVAASVQDSSCKFAKFDSAGNKMWEKKYRYYPLTQIKSIVQSSDKGFVLSGGVVENMIFPDTLYRFYVLKVNSVGDTLWSKIIDRSLNYTFAFGNKVLEAPDLGILVAGQNYGEFMVKLDINGSIYGNAISGKLFLDANGNCTHDVGEKSLPNWLVKLMPGNRYTSTDANGNYSFRENQGNFTISPVFPNHLYTYGCPAGARNVNFSTMSQTSLGNDFALNAIPCALTKVDIATPFLRRCFRNNYSVNYSNEGTATASNAQVKIEFPESIIPLSSTLPWSTQNGNVYTFPVGDLDPGEKGYFVITDSVSCLVPLSSTHCVKATITPFDFCQAEDPSWDKSSILLVGACGPNFITHFTIANTGEPGEGDMDGTSEFRVYFNNVLDSVGTFQLAGGETLSLNIFSRGQTVRVEADQRPGHPGRSKPRATVEGCGAQLLGFRSSVPEDDEDEYVEIDCQTIIGSFDPNDKSVKPLGITEHNYIPTGTKLEYQIRFQNTGTDTAFTVVVRDAISEHLDISSFTMESASHSYTYKIISGSQQVIEWRFNNILLADSNVNEPKSHGYIRFKINQKENLPLKAVIENNAAIYFDYNDAVITNTTRSVVFDTTMLGSRLTGLGKTYKKEYSVSAYPNPFNDQTRIEITGLSAKVDLLVMDRTGRVCKHLKEADSNNLLVSQEGLMEGMYIYTIYSEGNLIGTGKLVIIK